MEGDQPLKAEHAAPAHRALRFGIERLGLLSLRQPVFWSVAIVCLSVLALGGLLRLTADDSLSELFRTDSIEFRRFEDVDRRFPSNEYDVLVVVEGKPLLTREGVAAFTDTMVDLQLADGVQGVVSMLSARGKPDAKGYAPPIMPDPLPEDDAAFADAVKALRSNDIVRGKFLSDDGELALGVIALDRAKVAELGSKPIIEGIRKSVEAGLKPAGLSVQLTGAPVMKLEIRNAIERDQILYNGLGLATGILIAVLFFRSIAFVAMAALPPILGVVWSLGLLGWMGIKLNLFLNIMTPLVMVMGFADSMQLIGAIRDRLGRGDTVPEAIAFAINVVGPACVLAHGAALLSFLALMTSPSGLVYTFGFAGALATAVSLVVVMLSLPVWGLVLLRDHAGPVMLSILGLAALTVALVASFGLAGIAVTGATLLASIASLPMWRAALSRFPAASALLAFVALATSSSLLFYTVAWSSPLPLYAWCLLVLPSLPAWGIVLVRARTSALLLSFLSMLVSTAILTWLVLPVVRSVFEFGVGFVLENFEKIHGQWLTKQQLLAQAGFWLIVVIASGLIFQARMSRAADALAVESSDRALVWLSNVIGRIVDAVLRRPVAYAVAGLLVFALCLAAHLSLSPRYRLADQVPDREQAVAATSRLDRKLTGGNPVHVMISWTSRKSLTDPAVLAVTAAAHTVLEKEAGLGNVWSLDSLRRWLEEAGEFSPDSMKRYLGLLPEHLVRRFIAKEEDRLLVTGRLPDIDASDIVPIVERIDRALDAVRKAHPGFEVSVTGLPVVAARSSASMIAQLKRALPYEVAIVCLLIGLALRSWSRAALSVIPALFPVSAAGAVLLFSSDGLEFSSAIAMIVIFGVGIDSLIHFLNRLRLEERPGEPLGEAIRSARILVGPAIVLTTIVLTLGLGVTMLSDLPSLRTFGIVCATALLASLIGDLVFLPALLVLVRRLKPGARGQEPQAGT